MKPVLNKLNMFSSTDGRTKGGGKKRERGEGERENEGQKRNSEGEKGERQ